MNLIRRHPGAFSVSAISTIVAVVLATIANWRGAYDPSLAVLTATLVAVIWYTFFSYCALHRGPAASVVFRLYHTNPRMVVACAENRSVDRTVIMKWRVIGRRNGNDVDTGSELGAGTLTVTLRPGEIRELNFPFPAAAGVPGSNFGPAVQLGEPPEALLQTDLAWKDDLRNGGYIGPDYYAVDVLSMSIRRYQVVDAREQAWRAAGGAKLPPLAV